MTHPVRFTILFVLTMPLAQIATRLTSGWRGALLPYALLVVGWGILLWVGPDRILRLLRRRH